MAVRPPRRIRAIFAAAVVLGVGAALFWAWSLRIDPSTLPQDHLHEIGTTGDGVRMRPLPDVHQVVLKPVHADDLVPMLRAYLPRPLGSGYSQVQGYYDTETRTIHVTGPMTRLSASSPFPAFRGLFVHALRHEYGHAFFDDWLRSRTGSTVQLGQFSQPDKLTTTDGLPRELVPVVEEFGYQPSDIYGDPYPMTNFNEYFAESYARFIEGRHVPSEMERFLAAGAGGG